MIILFSCVGLIILLYFWSHKKNGNEFRRLVPSHTLTDQTVTDLEYNSFYIAGKTSQTVYLGNITAPEYVSEHKPATGQLTHYRLTLTNQDMLKREILILAVDSSGYHLFDGNHSLVLRSADPGISLNAVHPESLPHFSAFCPLSESSFFLRIYNGGKKISSLVKISSVPYAIQENSGLLQKQVDGLFDVDGMMQYDPDLHFFIYLYYYRNQFIVSDTNLNLIFRGKTLDSNTTVKFSVARINHQLASMISGPQITINKKLRVDRGLIFIQSGLISKTEPSDLLKKYAIIDVYALKDGVYKYSFYVPKYQGDEVSDFTVLKDQFIYLSGHSLICYRLNLPGAD